MSERTLAVRGIGHVKARPNLIVVTIKQVTTTPSYAQTMELAAQELAAIRKAVAAAGHEEQTLKTTDFNIEAKYENYKDSNGNWQRRFIGYSCCHNLKMQFTLDMRLLDGTVKAISACGANPQLQIEFSLKDKNALEAELLEKAVADAAEKAAVLAKASGVTLGAIRHINYSWDELRLYSSTKANDIMFMIEYDDEAPSTIEPEDIKAKDGATVIWEIY